MGLQADNEEPGHDLEVAIAHLEQAVRLSPGNARYSGLLGEAWLLRGDPEAGLAPLQNSLQQEPHPRIASLMAFALLRLDRPAEAAQVATMALGETSAFHRGHFLRAEARTATGDVVGAIEDLRQAISLAPSSEPYRLRLATHLVDRARAGDHGSLVEAREVLDSMDAPREARAWRYLRGCVLVELGEPDAALLAFDNLSWPTASEVALRRAYALVQLERRDEAVLALQEARVDPPLTVEADRVVAELNSKASPIRAAPMTELVTAIVVDATQVLASEDDQDESAAEMELLQSSPDGDVDSASHIKDLSDEDPDDAA